MNEIINLLQSTTKRRLGYSITFLSGLFGSLVLYLVFDNLRPITIPISLLALTFLVIKAYQQIQRNNKYNKEVEHVINLLEQNQQSSIESLNKLIVDSKLRIKNIENEEQDPDVRLGLFSNKEKVITSLKIDLNRLQEAKKLLKKEKSAN